VRSFFIKIFLWFWFAMVLVGLSAVIATVTLQPSGTFDHWRRLATSPLRVAAAGAAAAYEEGGARQANSYLRRLRSDTSMPAYLFDSSGHELSTLNATALARQAVTHSGPLRHVQLNDGVVMTAITQPVRGAYGRHYVLVAIQRVYLPIHNRSVVLRFIAVTLTGGLICAWLARNIASPIAELRKTARRLATGELSVRVPRSVTRRRDEIAQLGRDFDSMASHLEALITAQRRLLADISHELRSPLARLGVAVGLARRTAGDESTAYLDRIEREAERLNDLIGQLTTLSRLETGSGEAPRVPVDLRQLLTTIVADANYEAQEAGKTVSLAADNADLASPIVLNGDPELLRRGLENVIRNAVRYTEPGSTVDVTLRTEKDRSIVCVRDHGPGVPHHALTEIFRPFYRLQDDRGRDTGGVGLGLAIADRAIRFHEGDIAAENAQGGGLAVTITLPIGKAAPIPSRRAKKVRTNL